MSSWLVVEFEECVTRKFTDVPWVLQTLVVTSPIRCKRHLEGAFLGCGDGIVLFLRILRDNSMKQLLLSKQKTSPK